MIPHMPMSPINDLGRLAKDSKNEKFAMVATCVLLGALISQTVIMSIREAMHLSHENKREQASALDREIERRLDRLERAHNR